ncbi:MAG: D-arabinono-1,4-lactone oxidase [Caldilineaceae bacterium]
MTTTWTNWSGSVRCTPQSSLFPQSEADVVDLVRQARATGAHIRVTGAGHSFVPLCASDEMLIALDNLQGIGQRTKENEVVVWAGTKLHQLGDPLWALGLALANMGDIDRQAIAGAISTGTHGTGRTLGSIATQVVGLRLVIASGEVIECSPTVEPEIFKAAQISLGALGVITQVTLRLLPAYQLHERTWVASFAECLTQLDELIKTNRHFEFFWAPSEDACAMKALNPIAPDVAPPLLQVVQLGQNGEIAKAGVKLTGRLPRYISDDRVDRSYRIFPSERNLKFNEIEFAVPATNGPDCLCEIRQLMQTQYPAVIWPIEYRTLAADDIDLSPAYQRPTVTLSVHQAAELPYRPFFADVEAIFRNHQGRPHWGKIHTHTAPDFRSLYPRWEHFQTVRQQLDPTGCFTNAYLHPIFA